MSQLALARILRQSEISYSIIGATKPENVKASDVLLSKNILLQIDQVLDFEPEWPITYKPNRFTYKMR